MTEEQLKKLLHQDKVTSTDVRSFKKEPSSMVVDIMEKITEKSPLHFTVVKNANAFDLISMTNLEPTELRANMRNLLTCIVSLNILCATFAEQALPQYSDLLAALTHKSSEKAKSFDCNDTRLDNFFFNETAFNMSTELQSALKLILF